MKTVEKNDGNGKTVIEAVPPVTPSDGLGTELTEPRPEKKKKRKRVQTRTVTLVTRRPAHLRY